MRYYAVSNLVHKFFYTGMHRDGIRVMFWGAAIRMFAITTVGLFVPVFVYKMGVLWYGGDFIAGIRALIVFLIIQRLSIIASSLLVEQLVDKIGFRLSLTVSSLLLISTYLVLPLAETDVSFLWAAAVLSGFAIATYWIPRHALFGEDQDAGYVGSSLGLLILVMRLVTILGPVIGGILASVFGFAFLFHIGLVFGLLSAIPYFFMHHHKHHHPDGLRGLYDKMFDPVNFPLIIAWFGRSWDNELQITFWPLYVYLVVGGVRDLGILTSLAALVAMVSVYLAGKIFDRSNNRKRLFLIGSLLTALVWPVKALAKSFTGVLAIDSLDKATNSFYWIPFLSETYRFAYRKDSVAFFAFREIVFSFGTLFLLLLSFVLTFSWSWSLLFLLGAMGVFLSMNLVNYRRFE